MLNDTDVKKKGEFFNIVLYNPQIPPNTGNILRLCSNTNTRLHLIKPLGFELNNKSLRRAGLDYKIDYEVYDQFRDFIESQKKNTKKYFISKYGNIKYSDQKFERGDSLIFGSEITGIPKKMFNKYEFPKLFIPMKKKSRSINLSNAVSICVYEALRQNHFFNLEKFAV